VPEELDGAINAVLGHLVLGGREAQRKIKDLVRTVAAGPVNEALIADTAKRIAEIRVSPEGKEGIASFFEKRKPAWVKDFEAVRVRPPRKKK
jgi:methylglutaconyl-CoA hydratase